MTRYKDCPRAARGGVARACEPHADTSSAAAVPATATRLTMRILVMRRPDFVRSEHRCARDSGTRERRSGTYARLQAPRGRPLRGSDGEETPRTSRERRL